MFAYEKYFLNNYFWKITNLTRNFSKKSFFPEDFDGTKPPENCEK